MMRRKWMYGLIGKMNAQPGRRDDVLEILLGTLAPMPGCTSYVVALDPEDTDGIWITEVWDSRDSHQASLQLPSVREAIARARPLIAGFSHHVETTPVDGLGLQRSSVG
jgi:quinol monooxygenase YgiN